MNSSERTFFSMNGQYLSIGLFLCMAVGLASPSMAQITYRTARSGTVTEIRNGKMGIAIPEPSSFRKDEARTLSPIQYFIYADGRISDTSANFLQIQYPRMGGSGPLSMTVKWHQQGPDSCRVEIVYTFRKGKFDLYGKSYPGGDPGPGYYRCVIRMRKGEKTIVLEDEYDYEISHSVELSNGLDPDQLRYRGWLSDAEAAGYEKKGQKYRSEVERGFPMDATVDIQFEERGRSFPLGIWQPAGGEINMGRYWMAYAADGGPQSNLFGLFQGSPENMLGGMGLAVNLYAFQEKGKGGNMNKLNLTLGLERRGPDDSWFVVRRQQWCVFLSSKTDLRPSEQVQPIALAMNKYSGLADQVDSYADKPARMIPGFSRGAIFSNESYVQSLISRVQQDIAFYEYLCNADSYYKPVFDAWRSASEERKLVQELISFGQSLKKNYKDGEGVFREDIRYWKGANVFKLKAISIASLLANPNHKISAAEKLQLESLVRMMARILWDERNAPMRNGTGVNLGTANMPTQYFNSRYFFALLFADDPEFSKRAKEVDRELRQNIRGNIYANGSSFGTPHYIQPAIEPILFTALQLKQAGVSDLFAEEPLLKNFAWFYLGLLTPPSPRFAGNRKIISFGDGSEESAVVFGLLGTGFGKADPDLSTSLLEAYHYGPPRMSLFGPVFLASGTGDGQRNSIKLGPSSFTGYSSNLRTSSGKYGETSVWMLNGDSLFDHRNDDRGEIALYALGAPLSVSRSSFYYPHATDGRIRSMVVPAQMFAEWSGEMKTISERSMKPGTWSSSTQTDFFSLGKMQGTESRMKNASGQWTRKVCLVDVFPEAPVVVILDTISGGGEHIWSMMMFSEGAVQTPLGKIEPEKRIHNNADRQELPRSSPVQPLKPGLQRFRFFGQPFNKTFHAAGGINWDMYTIAEGNMQFGLSQWTTTWQNSSEKDDYQKSFQRPYEEGQQILRIKGGNRFFTLILPRLKNAAEPATAVQVGAGMMLVPMGRDSLVISKTGFYSRVEDGMTISSWGKETFSFRGMEIKGGPVLLDKAASVITIRVHGQGGKRFISLPFAVKPPVSQQGMVVQSEKGRTILTIDYQSPALNLLPNQQGFREFKLTLQ